MMGVTTAALDVPSLVVSIDQYSNPDATVLQVSFGGSLGTLNDSINALKHLGVDVAKRTITAEGSVIKTQAFVTRVTFLLEA
ncbi:ACT domain-containing protein ACR12-like protein [Tanacetum coccineum]